MKSKAETNKTGTTTKGLTMSVKNMYKRMKENQEGIGKEKEKTQEEEQRDFRQTYKIPSGKIMEEMGKKEGTPRQKNMQEELEYNSNPTRTEYNTIVSEGKMSTTTIEGRGITGSVKEMLKRMKANSIEDKDAETKEKKKSKDKTGKKTTKSETEEKTSEGKRQKIKEKEKKKDGFEKRKDNKKQLDDRKKQKQLGKNWLAVKEAREKKEQRKKEVEKHYREWICPTCSTKITVNQQDLGKRSAKILSSRISSHYAHSRKCNEARKGKLKELQERWPHRKISRVPYTDSTEFTTKINLTPIQFVKQLPEDQRAFTCPRCFMHMTWSPEPRQEKKGCTEYNNYHERMSINYHAQQCCPKWVQELKEQQKKEREERNKKQGRNSKEKKEEGIKYKKEKKKTQSTKKKNQGSIRWNMSTA